MTTEERKEAARMLREWGDGDFRHTRDTVVAKLEARP